MACSNHWRSPLQVGSHHIARALVGLGWQVAFVSDPISPFHVAAGLSQELRRRFAIYRRGGIWDLDGRLWAYVPGALVTPNNKPLLASEWVHRRWPALIWPDVVAAAAKQGFEQVDLLYIDSVAQAFWLSAVRYRRSVLRVADRNAGFRKFGPAMQKLELEVAGAVDLVVYAARALEPHVAAMRPKAAFYLPNGVNFEHFAEWRGPVPSEYAAIPPPIAVYVGAMDVWFDYDLLDWTAARLPAVSFVLIGPDSLARTRFRTRENIHLLGPRQYAELPPYLQYADVGIIPFDVAGHGELIHSVHPLKLYEYLACGLPVVAVEWEELKRLESPAQLCRTREEFVGAIARAVSTPRDKEALIRYAAGQRWAERVKGMLERLDQLE